MEVWGALCGTSLGSVSTCISSYLSNGDSLLLHDLVYGSTITIQHFVKLINAANPLVSQHQGTSLWTVSNIK